MHVINILRKSIHENYLLNMTSILVEMQVRVFCKNFKFIKKLQITLTDDGYRLIIIHAYF